MRNIFEKPPVKTARDDVLVFFCVHNEVERLPYFLDYYRAQGVRHFFAVDNNSDDGTTEFLKSQPDVHYFFTAESYVSSRAGRLWTSELADFYGRNRWCLTLDVDELFVFPGIEKVTIRELTWHLDKRGFDAVFCIFLDMYSDRPLSETLYEPGTPFLDTCPFFERDTYTLHAPRYFPQVQISGGPRQRQFWESGGLGRGPAMRKVPLVKWRKGMQYYFSTHSLKPVPMATFTGALLHFKFFASFRERARREVERGDRVQMADYRKYAEKLQKEEVCFHRPESIRYEDSLTLLRHGVVTADKELMHFLHHRITQKEGRRAADAYRDRFREIMERAEKDAPEVRLTQLPHVWKLVNNPHFPVPLPGGDRAPVNQARMEPQFMRLMETATMRRTRRLRKWLHARGALDKAFVPEDLTPGEMTPERLVRIYESFWWELGLPFRLFRRIRTAVHWRRLFSGGGKTSKGGKNASDEKSARDEKSAKRAERS